ncbi:hypothetical protein EDB89DRAFT_2075565 [Lactarius sanguifluus]|nr:hypothetical protein EDB89DRAFT_2075565 [Lactarius sanguifluus]
MFGTLLVISPPRSSLRWTGVGKISFFQQDLTKPFPDDMLGTFDLAHMTYMCRALRHGLVVGYARTTSISTFRAGAHRTTALSYHLRKMLQDASFQVLSSTRILAPHREYCASHKGLNGTSISGYTAFSLQNSSQITNVLTSALMEAGDLELGDGTRIADEDGRQVLMKELRDFAEGGVLLLMSEWVVMRPRPLGS